MGKWVYLKFTDARNRFCGKACHMVWDEIRFIESRRADIRRDLMAQADNPDISGMAHYVEYVSRDVYKSL